MIYDFIELDKSLKTPLCTQLYNGIREAIQKEKFQQDEKLPSIRRAAKELQLSRTTVETAYIKLCNQGYIYSKPQSGFFAKIPKIKSVAKKEKIKSERPVRYDFSSGRMDEKAADTALWKKYIRCALHRENEIISYGMPQGEEELRSAIAAYTFRTRSVLAKTENVIVGAGTQFLLTLFCSLHTQKGVIAMDSPGFKQAERIFSDYGFQTVLVNQKSKIPLTQQLEKNGASVYLDIPANHPQKSKNYLHRYRQELLEWVREKEDRIILEDDYNGELSYTARPMPAMQNMDTEHIVYLGSFSQLLLPSVRIAYMVLPSSLLSIFQSRQEDYNSTASKIEQLALAQYIADGLLEKHLRRLKKLYYQKNQCLLELLKQALPCIKRISILETSLSVIVHLETKLTDAEIEKRMNTHGIRLDSICQKHIRLSFSGMPIEQFPMAVKEISKALLEP